MSGQVYLLHFDAPLGSSRHHATHYIGSTDDLTARLSLHQHGQSDARIMTVLWMKRIGFSLARVWDGDRKDERALKNRKKAALLCPVCQGLSAGIQHFDSPAGDRPEYIPFAELEARRAQVEVDARALELAELPELSDLPF